MYRRNWRERKKNSVNQRTPSLPEVETPSSRPAVGSQDPDEDPIEPFEEHPPVTASKKRRASAAALGASPKAKTQRGLEAWVRRSDQVPQPKASLTAEEVMNPSKPVIRDQQPKSGSQGDIKKWMEQFDVETQQTAKKILEMLADHKYSKAKLQNAAAQYGLNVQDSLKYQPKSLQQVIAYAAAMSSWLALAHHLFAPHEVHSDIKILRAFLIQIIHHVPAIQKNMAMWSFGLLHLVSLFGYPSGTSVTTIWQRRLSSLGISLETYTFAFFNHACSVYIKLPFYWTFQKFSDKIAYHQHGRFYIGSTSISAAKRDFNRMAKLKQTLSDSAVHVELAIRYWASNPSDFEQFSTIVLRTTTLYQDAWIYEHLLISKWQAPLNFPFITEILKLKAKGWQLQYRRHNQQFPRVPLGDRLYRRVRRKLHSLHCFISESSFLFYTDWRHQDALPTTQLPVSDLASFMTGNSTPFIDWQPIWKNHLDLRLATRWNKRSNFVIWPNHLWIPLWAYLSWHLPLSIRILQGGCEIMYFDTKRWLFHCTYLQPSYVKLPFPRFGTFFTTIEEQKHGGILTMLITFLVLLWLDSQTQYTIAFHHWPHSLCLWRPFGPYTSPNFSVSQCEFYVLLQPTTIFWTIYTANHFMDSTTWTSALYRWGDSFLFRCTMVTPYPRVDSYSTIYISQHQTSSTMASPRSDFTPWGSWTSQIDSLLPKSVFQGAWNTWNDPELFRRLPLTYDEAQGTIERSIPHKIQKKYKWAINTKSALRNGFVFLKRKKQFKKGRTLISYFRSRYGRLLQVTARTIDSMQLQLWPQTMGQLAVPQIWQTVHHFLSDTPLDIHLHAVNDDLVGFFNSVPQDRLLDAVNSLILEWKHRHPDTVLSVDMSQRGNPLQLSYVGKIHKAPKKTKVIFPDDIFTIVQGSLSCHIFQAVNVIWQQIRGAGIGSQISPSLSNLAVTIVERSWTQAF